MAGEGTTTNLNAVFKQVYDTGSQVMTAQQNLYADDFKNVTKSPLKLSPNGIQIPLAMSGNESGGAYNESEQYQQVQSELPVRGSITAKYTRWQFAITGTAIDLSASNVQAFVDGLQVQMKGALGRMFSDLNRQTFGTGTGVYTTVAANALAGATTITVSSIYPFRRNQIIEFWTAFGGTLTSGGHTVTGVDFVNNQITITPGLVANVNSGYAATKQGLFTAAPTDGKEIGGYARMVDTTTVSTSYLGINASTNTEWQANVIDAGAAPVSQDVLQRLYNRICVVGGIKPDYLISNFGQHRVFLGTELQKSRYTDQEIKAGGIKLMWGDLEWKVSKDCQTSTLYMLNKQQINKYQVSDPKIADYDGLKVARRDDMDAVSGYYVYRGNFGTWKRNAHGKLTNLQEPTF